MAEGVGFEPTVDQGPTLVFETSALNRSAIPPGMCNGGESWIRTNVSFLTDLQSAAIDRSATSPMVFGSPGRIRTYDLLINSQLPYRLATGKQIGDPNGIRTRVVALKGQCPNH